MNAVIGMMGMAVATAVAVVLSNPVSSLALGRWLIARSYAQRAARAEMECCYSVWEGESA